MAACDDENRKLEEQIAYLTAAINHHKKNPPPEISRTWQDHRHHQSSRFKTSKFHKTSSQFTTTKPLNYQNSTFRNPSSSHFSLHRSSAVPTDNNALCTKTKIVKKNVQNVNTQKQFGLSKTSDKQLYSTQKPVDITRPLKAQRKVPVTNVIVENVHISPCKSNYKIDKRTSTNQPRLDSSEIKFSKTSTRKIYSQTSSTKQFDNQQNFKINRQVNSAVVQQVKSVVGSDAAAFVNQVMGRTVSNVSQNQFKFVKKKERVQTVVPTVSRLRLDRRRRLSSSSRCRMNQSLVMVNGRVVKSPRRLVTRTTVKNRRVSHDRRDMVVDRRLSDVRRNKNNDSQRLAQSVLHRSRKMALKASKKRTLVKKYCTFYNRFGVCNRGDKCPFVHDKTKVAVCRRFILGKCPLSECPFSHRLVREKMPVCGYYLRGLCTKDVCPYRHVNVNKDADVCQDFLDGHCADGEKCEKRHSTVCQMYVTSGRCLNRTKCKLRHPQKRRQPPKQRHKQKTEKQSVSVGEEMLKPGQMPSFIRLDSDSLEEHIQTEKPSTSGLQIRPFFGID